MKRRQQMSLRQADAALAEMYLHWRWVSGTGPVQFGWYDSDWLLPEDVQLPDVREQQWEILDERKQGKLTVKALPHFTTDIAAAWMLAELLDDVELGKVEGKWRCRVGEVVQLADNAALALARAAYTAGRRL